MKKIWSNWSALLLLIVVIAMVVFLLNGCNKMQPQAQAQVSYAAQFEAPMEADAYTKLTDNEYIDSCFRWLEKKSTGGSVKLQAKEYILTKDVILPQMIKNTVRKKFLIDMNGAKILNFGFTDTARTWQTIHNVNTFRSFVIRNGEFNGAKQTALKIQGCQMNNFENLVFAGCKTGGYFGLCLQTQMDLIEENQCRDTGVYIGLAQGIGCDASNSQSNNVTLTTFRSFGAGNAMALIADQVSGCRFVNLTNEGAGSKYFLYVNGKNSNWMKSFIAQDLHIETENRVACIYAYLDGYARFTFENIWAQHGNILVDGYGTGTIYVNDIVYQPNIPTDKYPTLKCKNNGGESSPLWWQFTDCTRYGGKPFKDPFYWILQQGTSIPKPFADGQVSNNNGVNRLKEIIQIKE